MESAVDTSEARSDPVHEKRAPDELDVYKDPSPPMKRSKTMSDRPLVGDVRKVGEMVLVLAAMGKMRGGRDPSDAEKELMAEARARLAKVCEGFAPKDVFPRDAFEGVIEDLGLNKLKEQKSGFRPPSMSIAEKLLVSKRKMEKAESFFLPFIPHSSRLHPSSASAAESRNVAHPGRMPQPDKSSHMSISPGSFQSLSPSAHTTPLNSASFPYQLPTSEIRPAVSSVLPSSNLNSAALSRVDRSHIRSDGRPNGSPLPPQIQANSSANKNVKTPTWSVQPQPAVSSKTAVDNKVPGNMSLKVAGATGMISGLPPYSTARAVASQMQVPLSQSVRHVQPPLGNAHVEIGKIVQKLLQPQVSNRPTWVPPSRDYMSKALTCQICMLTVTEIDSILICDACEKGYHLKCLQTTNQKGVPRGEWHCGKCLSLSNGKPLPPKYGRVMRNVNTPKMSLNASAITPIPSKPQSNLDEKLSQTKAISNGNSTMENSSSGVVRSNYNHHKSGSEGKVCKAIQEDNISHFGSQMDDIVSSGIPPNTLMRTPGSINVSPVSSVDEKSDVKTSDLKVKSSTEPVKVPISSDKLQAIPNDIEAAQSKHSLENHFVARDSEDSQGNESSNNTNHLKERVVHDSPPEIAANTIAMNQDNSSPDSLRSVSWVGDPIQIFDGKVHYTSCCVSGHLYKLMDHVHILIDSGKLIPSKLMAMWEDKKTTTKWVMVNRCYFPGDLPEAVGRPCNLESSEVYESTCIGTVMAGLIVGPCEVLSPRRFAEEGERRIRSGRQINEHLPPIYLCKWIYDKAKGLFRDISC